MVRCMVLVASNPGARKFSVIEKDSPGVLISHCGLVVRSGVTHWNDTPLTVCVFVYVASGDITVPSLICMLWPCNE